MKLAPITTARCACLACAMIARLSASERSVWTCGSFAPGMSSRIGSAPVASSSLSNATLLPARKRHLVRLDVDPGHVGAEHDFDRMLAVEFGRPQRDPLFRRVAREIVLGQIRPVVGRGVVGRQQRDAAGKPFAPEHLGRRECRRAAADDHHALGIFAGAARLGRAALLGRFDLLAHPRLAVALLHRQHETGLSAGAATASPVRRLKQAWCQGHRTVSPTTSPSASGPP